MKNAEINKAARMKKAAEDEEERKKKEEASINTEEISDKAAKITPRNLHNAIFSNDEAHNDDKEEDMTAIMDIDGAEESQHTGDTSGLSPVKKRSKGKKRSSSRPRVSPPGDCGKVELLEKKVFFFAERFRFFSTYFRPII
jgi:hypothetical protein